MRRRTYLTACIGLALLVTACGNVAEELTERAIEAESGGEVDVDFENDDDGATFEFSDGEDDESGTVRIGGSDLPDDFPIPVPGGSEVSSTGSITSDETTQYSAVLIWEGDQIDRVVEFYEDYFDGMSDITRSEFTSEDTSTTSWSTADYTTSVSVTHDDEEVIVIIQAQK